jgi:hypothetical protein
MPPKPRMAAIKPIIRNVTIQPSITGLRRWALSLVD